MAIASFRHKGLKRLYDADDASKLPADMLARIRLILTALDAAETMRDMEQPTFRLHQLKGKLRGLWAVTVRANWRITFRIEAGSVSDVDFVDYH